MSQQPPLPNATVATKVDNSTPPKVLPVAPPPLSTPLSSPLQPPREQVATTFPVTASVPPVSPLLTPRAATPQPSSTIKVQLPTPTPVKLFQSPPTQIRPLSKNNK